MAKAKSLPAGHPYAGTVRDPNFVQRHRAKVDGDGKPVLDAKGRPVVEPIPKTDAEGSTPKSRRMG